MEDARLKILKMLEDGKITAEEAAKLLEAIEKGGKKKTESVGWTAGEGRRGKGWLGFGDLMFEVGEIVREAVTAAFSVVPAAIQGAVQGGEQVVDETVDVPPELPIRVSASTGDVNLRGVDSNQASFKGECVPGGLSINRTDSGIEVKMTGGDFDGTLPKANPIELNISAGDLDFRDAGGVMKINVSVGDADVEFAEVRDVQAMVKGGDLSITVPRDADFTAEIEVIMGDFSVPESENVSISRSGGKTIVRFGTGTGGRLTAKVKMGNLSISFR